MTSASYLRLSPPGAAALSIWRLRGSPEQLRQLLARRSLPATDEPVLCRLSGAAGEAIDEGVLWLRAAGAVVEAELHLHGGAGVASAWRSRLAELGWSEQEPTPLDPDWQRLLGARAPLNARVAAALCSGEFERRLAAAGAAPPAQRVARLAELARYSQWAEILEEPPLVVLAGPPNAGKSTLFNLWLRQERVTVSPHPGTTRDSVEAGVLLGHGADAFEARLVDTAGLWRPGDELDRAAVRAARRRLVAAWRVVWVFDAAVEPDQGLLDAAQASGAGHVRLVQRCDLPAAWEPPGGGWLRGSPLRDGPAWIARIEEALLAPLGPAPPPGALLPLGEARRHALAAARAAAPG